MLAALCAGGYVVTVSRLDEPGKLNLVPLAVNAQVTPVFMRSLNRIYDYAAAAD